MEDLVTQAEYARRTGKTAHRAGGTDLEVESFCECKAIKNDEASGPALVASDGRTWSLLPKWLRASAQ